MSHGDSALRRKPWPRRTRAFVQASEAAAKFSHNARVFFLSVQLFFIVSRLFVLEIISTDVVLIIFIF